VFLLITVSLDGELVILRRVWFAGTIVLYLTIFMSCAVALGDGQMPASQTESSKQDNDTSKINHDGENPLTAGYEKK